MTTVQQEVSADPMIMSAPASDASLKPAGETGSEWYDFSKSGAITSDIWDKTISNTDQYPAGTTLFAIDANPVSVPGGSGGGKPPSMASHLVQTFRQMVFENMVYTFVCSKGSLTNAKLIAAFIPGITLSDFSSLSDQQKKSVLDRQSNKVIFSPSPNETNVLTVNWAHTTSIINVGENMGIVALAIYQKVVANIADGGSNDIHITTRFSVTGLKCRYPVPPGLVEDNDVIELDQLELFQPCNPNESSASLPLAHSSVMTDMPTMVALPKELLPDIPKRMFGNTITKEGEQGFYIQGLNNMFNLSSLCFKYFYDPDSETPFINPDIPYFFSVARNENADFKTVLRFPFQVPDGAEFSKLSGYEGNALIFYMYKMKNNDHHICEAGDVEISSGAGMVHLTFTCSATNIQDFNFPESNPLDAWCCGFMDASYIMEKGDVSAVPDVVGGGSNEFNVTHAIGWTSIPTPSTKNGFPVDNIVEAIQNGQAPPLVTNLTNQIGNSAGKRNTDELQADMVIGGSNRGPLEFIGKVAHTATSFIPLLSLLSGKKSETVVAEASSDFPIYYVETDTARSRSIPTGRVHSSSINNSRRLI